jgi:hypothetical protein
VANFNKMPFQEKLMKYGPLPIKVLAGIIFIAHGIPKLVNIPLYFFIFLKQICRGFPSRNVAYH